MNLILKKFSSCTAPLVKIFFYITLVFPSNLISIFLFYFFLNKNNFIFLIRARKYQKDKFDMVEWVNTYIKILSLRRCLLDINFVFRFKFNFTSLIIFLYSFNLLTVVKRLHFLNYRNWKKRFRIKQIFT